MLKNRFLLITLSILVIIILTAKSWTIQNKLRTDIHEDTRHTLQTVLNTTHKGVKTWVEKNRSIAKAIANTSKLDEIVNLYEKTHSTQEITGTLKPLDKLISALGFQGYSLVGKNNEIISTSFSHPHILKEQSVALKKLWLDNATIGLPVLIQESHESSTDNNRLASMFIGIPLKNRISNQNIALFLLHIDPYKDFNSLLQQGRIGKSGETYAFNEEGLMISESRFDVQLSNVGIIKPRERGILKVEIRDPGINLLKPSASPTNFQGDKAPLTLMAMNATAGQDGYDLEGYRDYRGVPVVGAWLWNPELNFGIATEMDAADAYSNLNSILLAIKVFTVFSIILIIGLCTAFVINRNLLIRQTKELSNARTEAENERQFIKAILDNAIDGIITINKKGIVQQVNEAACSIFGYAKEEVLNKNINLLMPEPYRSRHDGFIDNYLTTGNAKIIGIGREVPGLRKNGEEFPLWLGISKIIIDGEILFVGIVRDKTEQKRIDDMRNSIISIVSHELRTPLTAVQGAIKMLLSGVLSSSSSEYKELLDISDRNCHRLNKLIADMLMIGKIESGNFTLDLQPIDPNKLIQELLLDNKPYADKYGIQLQYRPLYESPLINVDQEKISQVIINLISNAVKASSKGSAVYISAERYNDQTLRVSVSDNGSGIPEKFRDSLFDKFTQAENHTTRQYEGSGLSLHICKAIITEHGGTIGFESTEGEGTIFYFDLPIA